MEKLKKSLELTDGNFQVEVLESDKPVLVDFFADWCGPCKYIGAAVEELAGEYQGLAKVTKLDVDNNPVVSSRYGVRNIPTLLIFKNGEVVDKIVGAVPKHVIEERLRLQTA